MIQKSLLILTLFFSGVCFISGCSTSTSGAGSIIRDSHERLNGALWIQTSAEYEIMTQTIYAQAKLALDRALDHPNWFAALEQNGDYQGRLPAIIVDIDETILDNSPSSGRLIKERSAYNHALWTEWAQKGIAASIPGALAFLQYAQQKGVTVFYITNREYTLEPATRQNLRNLGFPLSSDTDTVLTKNEPPHNWASDKTARRAFLANEYRILLLVGDDLGDFMSGVKCCPEARRNLAQKHSERWGVSWFLLPNPLYGSWETALYEKSLSDEQVLQKKFGQVKAFK